MLKRRWNYNLVIYLCGHRSLCVYALKLPLSPRVISVCWRLENNNSLSILQSPLFKHSPHLCNVITCVPCSTQNTWLYMHVRKTVGRNTLFFNNLMKVAMCCASFGGFTSTNLSQPSSSSSSQPAEGFHHPDSSDGLSQGRPLSTLMEGSVDKNRTFGSCYVLLV